MKIGLAGINTKLGRLLFQRPNFISDVVQTDFDLMVSCLASDEITDWGTQYHNTVTALTEFRKIHKTYPKVVLLVSSSRTKQNKIISLVLNETSKAFGWKIIKIPAFVDSEAEYIAEQVVEFVDRYPSLPRVSTCKRKSLIARLLGGYND